MQGDQDRPKQGNLSYKKLKGVSDFSTLPESRLGKFGPGQRFTFPPLIFFLFLSKLMHVNNRHS